MATRSIIKPGVTSFCDIRPDDGLQFQIIASGEGMAEKIALQKGMNYGVGKKYSVFLISLRVNAPYADVLDPVTGMLTYEGHDEPQRAGSLNPNKLSLRCHWTRLIPHWHLL